MVIDSNHKAGSLLRTSSRPRGPVTTLLDFVGSVPFGVTMLCFILVYAWLGSAGTAPFVNARESFIRQRFEKTEMTWFSWWPFTLSLAIFSVALILVTLRRIRFNKLNIGVWIVHSGILTLCLGSWIYFGTKVEGDAVIYRRQAVLTVEGSEPATLTLQPRATATVGAGSLAYQVAVTDLNPNYTLLTGEDKGKQAYTATLAVQPFENGKPGEQFMRQVIVGYPQYTEDVIPGQGRAVKVTGERLVDSRLNVDLQYAPVDHFFVRDSAALDVRILGSKEWTQFPLVDLPRYKAAVSSLEQVRFPPNEVPRVRPLDIEAEWDGRSPELGADVSFRVTGYLPYGFLKEFQEPGGDAWNPWLRLRVRVLGREATRYDLVAMDPRRNRVDIEEGVQVRLLWLNDPAELQKLLTPGIPELHVAVPGAGFEQVLPLTDLQGPVELGETGYTIEFQDLFPDWKLASAGKEGESATVGLVRVTSPEQTFTRAVVHPKSELSQDLDEAGQRHQQLLDPGILLRLENVVEPGLTVVAGGVGNHMLLTSRGGAVIHEEALVGQNTIFLDGSLEMAIEELSERSQRVILPQIIPFREQNPKTLPNLSLIRVEIVENGRTRAEWLEYSHYAHTNRIGYFPVVTRLQDGRQIEILYSRQSYPLPQTMVLEDFRLEQFPGMTRERDYISLIRFADDGSWGDTHEVRSNQPTEHAGWWFFQSTWDPPVPQANYAGMNYTGIGVGNRNGVLVMLLGSILVVVGTLYAFYLKPVLRRRQQQQLAARGAAHAKEEKVRRMEPEPAGTADA